MSGHGPTTLALEQVALHAGPDIEQACALSSVVAAPARAGGGTGLGSGLQRLVQDARSTASWNPMPRTLLVEGTEARTGQPMRILFRGRLQSVEFCARHLLGTDEFRADVHPSAPPDVLVSDHPLVDRHALGARPAIALDPWVRQHLELGATWQETLAARSGSLRKELRRLLRRHAFAVTVSGDEPGRAEFYRRLYKPYVARRFGRAAVLSDEAAFLRDSADAALLALRDGDRMIAGSVLTRSGEVLAIGWTGIDPELPVSDRADLLDYYCVLLAQKLGCRVVDFGRSRPHLDDGVFRYKCKWGTRLVPGGGPLKPRIRIRPLSRSPAVLSWLARNGFVERRDGRFLVRRLGDDATDDVLESAAARARLDGIVVAGTGPDAAHPATGGRVRRVVLPPGVDPVTAFLRLT